MKDEILVSFGLFSNLIDELNVNINNICDKETGISNGCQMRNSNEWCIFDKSSSEVDDFNFDILDIQKIKIRLLKKYDEIHIRLIGEFGNSNPNKDIRLNCNQMVNTGLYVFEKIKELKEKYQDESKMIYFIDAHMRDMCSQIVESSNVYKSNSDVISPTCLCEMLHGLATPAVSLLTKSNINNN